MEVCSQEAVRQEILKEMSTLAEADCVLGGSMMRGLRGAR